MSSFIPIASQTASGSTATITFSSIPTTLAGKNLRDLVITLRNGTSDTLALMRANGVASGYVINYFRTQGTIIGGNTDTQNHFYLQSTSLTASAFVYIHINDYASTDKHKVSLSTRYDTQQYIDQVAGRLPSNSAITSLTFTANSGNIPASTVISLYGIEG